MSELLGLPFATLILFIPMRYVPSGTMVRGRTATKHEGIYGKGAENFASATRYNRVSTRSRHSTLILDIGKPVFHYSIGLNMKSFTTSGRWAQSRVRIW
ncbi:hypothetical protein BDV27DRAFT_59770 [Aspergillus caelatus]|uniref:Uncharacterized protein n=1 Tax=Aspergillus caelatus TaxID=61420 RepID=A0A5N7ADF7_9EURO|nr:uncharacterized protein BDV27DRAFT_59770 [Aspergillus caelatus]KAE8367901.1 hypothetical protein BDV27DRAFT_59770 [Aspergillus caelatus]